MRYDLVLLDFDGTFTDVEKEAGPFFEAYLADVREILGPGFEADWEEATAIMTKDPANHGWLHEGRIVAPGNADPYLRATVVINMVFDRRGMYLDGAERTDLLQQLYHRNYPKADTVFRPDAKRVVEALLASDIPTFVVTNSATDDVQRKIDKLAPVGRERLTVHGNAKKFFVVDPEPNDARFTALPDTMAVEGLERPIYVRRGCYYEVLRGIWEKTGIAPERTLVAGDIFELDLALPAHLGASVQLVLKDKTEEFERRAVAQLPQADSSPDLGGILRRVGLV
ncbi:MAG: HAD family hydrolase [Sandaracinus sp.]|nr:HAD family hydrolase [Myxococcales bacterium]MCB9600438.1 HAD family hydrolase [Sandaracinus sp.]MCB9617539.1 HAD family hydrolase [Sandaracinus sp.]MCB9636358.1 HAD family hydrolase [Sandaracinus sp.]